MIYNIGLGNFDKADLISFKLDDYSSNLIIQIEDLRTEITDVIITFLNKKN